MSLQINEFTNDSFLIQTREEWEKLCEECTFCTPFQYPQWLISWWKYFGGSDLKAVSIRDGEKLIALGLFYIYKEFDGNRKCCLLGTGISDYLDIVTVSGKEAQCSEIFYNYLIEIQSQWDECDFQDIRMGSPFFNELIKKKNIELMPCNVCLFKVLDTAERDILYQVPKKLRNNIRRALKKLDIAGQWEFIEEHENRTNEALQNLFILHSARWESKRDTGVLNNEKVQAFHLESSELLIQKDMLKIFTLKLKSKVIATYYVLLHKRRGYAYLGGFDPLMEEFSPGVVSLYCVISELLKDGYACIDFLRGEEPYKKYWNMSRSLNYRMTIKK